MSDPSWAPTNETAEQIWIEEANIDGICIEAVGYGVHLTLFFLCFNLLWDMRKRQPKYAYTFLVYISALVVLGSIGAGTSLKINQEAFVNNCNFPGGPSAYNILEYGVAYNVVGTGAYIMNTWLQDGLLLYRFYIIWGAFWWLMIVPILLMLVSIIMSCFLLAQLARPGATLWETSSVNFALTYWSTSIATTILLTLLIVARLMYARYRMRKAMGPGHQASYLSVAAMLVESASLYAVFALVFIITYARGSSVNYLLFGPLGQVQSIAPLLITLRVSQGRAATKETMQETMLGTTKPAVTPVLHTSRPSDTAIELYSVGGKSLDPDSRVEVNAESSRSTEFKIRIEDGSDA
ncbi:unnamed protein product [Somion occarium]|uniref:Uncharacterized protein n=1 Tax=Somion occarium TaxID=3059160 RepID=A0ABP1CTA0_9APHY